MHPTSHSYIGPICAVNWFSQSGLPEDERLSRPSTEAESLQKNGLGHLSLQMSFPHLTSLLFHVPLTSPCPPFFLLPQNASDLCQLGVASAQG